MSKMMLDFCVKAVIIVILAIVCFISSESLSNSRFFQEAKLQRGPGYIAWTKTEPVQYRMEKVGDCERLTAAQRATTLGVGVGLPRAR